MSHAVEPRRPVAFLDRVSQVKVLITNSAICFVHRAMAQSKTGRFHSNVNPLHRSKWQFLAGVCPFDSIRKGRVYT